MIILKVLLGMIVLYIILRVKLLNETRTIYKAGYFAVGVFVWAVLWALNIAKYNTIIYYPIIELFK